MFGLGPQELVIILIIVVILFGGRKIPEILRGVGQGLREFRQASSGKGPSSRELDDGFDDDEDKADTA